MLTSEITDPDGTTPAALCEEYRSGLADVVETVGVRDVAASTGVDRDRLDAVAEGDRLDEPLTVEEAAAILSTTAGSPDADALLAELRDGLLLSMSAAVLDVDAIAAGLDRELGATAVQQKIEGRREMTLAEYAAIKHHIAVRSAP